MLSDPHRALPPRATPLEARIIRYAACGLSGIAYPLIAAAQPSSTALPMLWEAGVSALVVLGALAAIAVVNFFAFVATRDRSRVELALFVLGIALALAGISGIGEVAVWGANSRLAGSAAPAGLALAGLFAALLLRSSLQARTRMPKLDRGLQGCAWILATVALGAVILPESSQRILAFVLPALGALIMICVLRCHRDKTSSGIRLQIAGWGALLLGGAVVAAQMNGWLASTYVLLFIAQATLISGAASLSLGIAARAEARLRNRAEQQEDKLIGYEQQIEMLRATEEQLRGTLEARIRENDDLVERLQQSENRTLEMSHLDPLTGLVNHMLLADRIDQGIIRSKRHNTRVGVVVVDIDHFRDLREAHGPELGDGLLRDVAARLRGIVREQDTVARLEEDEFVIVLEEIFDNNDLQRVEQAIAGAFRENFAVADASVNITVALGTAIYPDGGKNSTALIKQAIKMMQRAKHGARRTHLDAGKDAAAA